RSLDDRPCDTATARPCRHGYEYYRVLHCEPYVSLFFFQAEDGIRDRNVTGVQTCALPISIPSLESDLLFGLPRHRCSSASAQMQSCMTVHVLVQQITERPRATRVTGLGARSEERRVGKEGRTRGRAAAERRTEKEQK